MISTFRGGIIFDKLVSWLATKAEQIEHAMPMNVRVAELVDELIELQRPDVDGSIRENKMAINDRQDSDDDDTHASLPAPKDFLFRRFGSVPVYTSLNATLRRNFSWSSSGSGDVSMETAVIEPKPMFKSQSMPNLFSYRSTHNRVLGMRVLASEEEIGIGRDIERSGAVARVAEFERFLNDL
jgi:hypothetical protein